MANEKKKVDLNKIDPEKIKQMEALVAKLQTEGKAYVQEKAKEVDRNRKAEEAHYAKLNKEMSERAAKVVTSTEKATHLFLDDERTPIDVTWVVLPAGQVWHVVKTFEEFQIYILQNELPKFISFDHDLGKDELGKVRKTGLDAATWLVEHLLHIGLKLPDWAAHSKNVTGQQMIERYLFNWGRMKKIYDSKPDSKKY